MRDTDVTEWERSSNSVRHECVVCTNLRLKVCLFCPHREDAHSSNVHTLNVLLRGTCTCQRKIPHAGNPNILVPAIELVSFERWMLNDGVSVLSSDFSMKSTSLKIFSTQRVSQRRLVWEKIAVP